MLLFLNSLSSEFYSVNRKKNSTAEQKEHWKRTQEARFYSCPHSTINQFEDPGQLGAFRKDFLLSSWMR